MRSRLTLSVKLLTAFGGLLLCLCFTFGVSLWMSRTMSRGQTEAVEVATRLQLASALKSYNTEMFASERAIIVASVAKDADGQAAWHARVQEVIAAAQRDVKQLHDKVDTDAARAQVKELGAGMKAWESGCLACHDEKSDATDPAVMQRLSAKTESLMKANQQLAHAIEESQQKAYEVHTAAARSKAQQSLWGLWLVMAMALGVSAAVLWLVRTVSRRLSAAARNLRQGVSQVFEAAAQVADSSQSLSQGASEQAASLEETSAAMSEMASMATGNATHAAEAAEWSATAEGAVGDANSALGDMVSSMESIRESGQKVSKILRTVDEIAFQTNILALNAAVEAARAGEAGMGFAVVADEVRSLAQRSAEAARNTASLIEESLAATRAGEERVLRVGSAITAVTEAIGRVRTLADNVREASAQQTRGFEQVAQALQQIEQTTQATAATAEESAAASETLNAEAQSAMENVERLDALVSGDAHAASHGHRAEGAGQVVGFKAPEDADWLDKAS
jgi:methyl-accepting chemotaxis protein/methyl-accepting chemotaxis protein-1 (serine sensor receptor)